jgi:hypothetical protein
LLLRRGGNALVLRAGHDHYARHAYESADHR